MGERPEPGGARCGPNEKGTRKIPFMIIMRSIWQRPRQLFIVGDGRLSCGFGLRPSIFGPPRGASHQTLISTEPLADDEPFVRNLVHSQILAMLAAAQFDGLSPHCNEITPVGPPPTLSYYSKTPSTFIKSRNDASPIG
jgi:hypothetical protein